MAAAAVLVAVPGGAHGAPEAGADLPFVYNCPYPEGSGTFTLTDGGGNSGWDSTWEDCSAWPGQD
ncbi:hypothetical protein AA958_26805 [Streptomyces sp. CNQ-509]|nr:hypothetical protein AA958_26805 [Streptomyces sp. CNQ-509]